MTHTITLQPQNQSFVCDADQTVLEAALKAGFLLPYGCRNGACGSCKGTLVSGEIDYGSYSTAVLSDDEKAAGRALFCKAVPRGEITIEARDVRRAGDIQLKRLPARVEVLEKVADDVAVVKLKIPANERLQFRAGQYIDILLRDGKHRSFSLANAPHDDALLELHIRHTPGGAFTDQLFASGKTKDIWRIEGPHGSFFLREDSDKPMIMVASGTGFAPIKAVIEHALHQKLEREIVLYWGGRRPQDLYHAELAASWQKHYPFITFIPVISDALAEDAWQGRTGFVHRAVMEDFPDLSGYQVYACGAPVVVSAAHADFVGKCKLPEVEFFSDAFTLAAPSEPKPVPEAPKP